MTRKAGRAVPCAPLAVNNVEGAEQSRRRRPRNDMPCPRWRVAPIRVQSLEAIA